MRKWGALALLISTLAGAAPAADQVVCRPNTLGTVSCPATVVRPLPRPPAWQPVQAIDRVRAKPPLGTFAPDFIPAPQARGLGKPILDRTDGNTICRPDTLGNLNCR